MRRNTVFWLWAAGVSAFAHAPWALSQVSQNGASVAVAYPRVTGAPAFSYGLQATALPGGWQLIAGANDDFSMANGCNIINTGFLRDGDEVLVINTGVSRRYGQQQAELVEHITGAKATTVLALNLHPDYFFGHQAYGTARTYATQSTMEGMRREGGAYADNLYRLCGDWMSGTESTPATSALEGNTLKLGRRTLELHTFKGHTDSDLVVLDRSAGVLWAGGLAFHNRVPTMPHARLHDWMDSLKQLRALAVAARVQVVVPSHGPASNATEAIDQTLDYLQWMDAAFKQAALQGLEMNQVLRMPIPQRFAQWAAMPAEFQRNVASIYPTYETAVFK